MRKGILLFAFLLVACGGADGGTLSTETSTNAWEVNVISTPAGSETISTPSSVLDTYTVGMNPMPADPKTYYFAIDAINQVFGFEVIIPVNFEDADIQVTQEDIEGAKLGLAYVYDGPYCNVIMDPEGAQQWKIVAHELLHCLGFGHALQFESMMHAHNGNGDFTNQMVPLWEETYKAQTLGSSEKNYAFSPSQQEPNIIVD